MSIRRIIAALAFLATSVVLVTAAPTPASAAPKDPVVIVPGFTTGPIVSVGYIPLKTRLVAAGYDTTLLVYPDYGLGDIHENAKRLKATVDAVKARTGASKVDLVAHSMGGLVSRDYIKNLNGAGSVDSLTMLGTPNYGTAVANLANIIDCVGITACGQMASGSSYLAALNAGDDTIGNVRYYSIATKIDVVATPYTRSFLANDGNIQNVAVQDQCLFRLPGHLTLITDGAVADGILDVLKGGSVRMNCFAL